MSLSSDDLKKAEKQRTNALYYRENRAKILQQKKDNVVAITERRRQRAKEKGGWHVR